MDVSGQGKKCSMTYYVRDYKGVVELKLRMDEDYSLDEQT
jgi:hypothetical protein